MLFLRMNPLASGYCDGNYNGLTLANLPVVSEQQDSIDNFLKSPIYTLYTTPNPAVFIGKSNSAWPTVACSSIDVYEKDVIPNWNRSLLIPSLKAGLIQRLKLDATGTKVIDITSIAAMNKAGQIKNMSRPLHYFIYNVTGKLLITGNSPTDYFSVNIESLTSGMYIFKLYNAYDINISTQKFMVR